MTNDHCTLPMAAASARWHCCVALGLALAACMLSPGKFVSELDIRKDGHFRFSYTGEIHVLALSQLADMMNAGGGSAQQRRQFHARALLPDRQGRGGSRFAGTQMQRQRTRRAEGAAGKKGVTPLPQRKRSEAESMKAMFGGIDPGDPKSAEELAARLRRQAGWRKVMHRGDGLFDVEFAIEGQLDHDFAFPTIERFPAANPFVQVMLRSDGTVRVDAPGFAPAAAGEPYRGWMQAAALSEGKQRMPKLPEMDGTFVITTDAAMLANNTEMARRAMPPASGSNGGSISAAPAPPMALVRLGR